MTGKRRTRASADGDTLPADTPAAGAGRPSSAADGPSAFRGTSEQIRGPLQGLQDLSEIVAEHPPRVGAFVRGLTIGALVGAAIAGSAIWRRWRRGKNS